MYLKAYFTSTWNNYIVRSFVTRYSPSFLSSIASVHFLQRLGEYPVESGSLVMIASSFDTTGLYDPAFCDQ
jgi:hypothetical protein